MEEDKGRFGVAAWASAAPRQEKLRFLLAKETLQHMRAAEMCLSRKKDSIRERVRVCVCSSDQQKPRHSISILFLTFFIGILGFSPVLRSSLLSYRLQF